MKSRMMWSMLALVTLASGRAAAAGSDAALLEGYSSARAAVGVGISIPLPERRLRLLDAAGAPLGGVNVVVMRNWLTTKAFCYTGGDYPEHDLTCTWVRTERHFHGRTGWDGLVTIPGGRFRSLDPFSREPSLYFYFDYSCTGRAGYRGPSNDIYLADVPIPIVSDAACPLTDFGGVAVSAGAVGREAIASLPASVTCRSTLTGAQLAARAQKRCPPPDAR